MSEMKFEFPEAERLARILWQATMATWSLCLGGGDWPAKREQRERMQKPQPGDLVVEASAGLRSYDCAQAVGWMVKEAREPAFTAEEWGDEEEPIPDEKVIYIVTLDGREARWTNCSFYQVPTYPGWWDYERHQLGAEASLKGQGRDARTKPDFKTVLKTAEQPSGETA